MPLRWKIFRIICIVQLLAASVNALEKLFYVFINFSFSNIVGLLLFIAIMLLCILGINLVNNNYPEEPVDGPAKENIQQAVPAQFCTTYFFVWIYYCGNTLS